MGERPAVCTIVANRPHLLAAIDQADDRVTIAHVEAMALDVEALVDERDHGGVQRVGVRLRKVRAAIPIQAAGAGDADPAGPGDDKNTISRRGMPSRLP